MAWIESHTRLRNHKKIVKLCSILKLERRDAIGLLHMWWWWAIEQRPDGDLIGVFPQEIAVACDWTGNPKKLVSGLQEAKFLGRDMKIIDWMDYAGKLLSGRERLKKWRGNVLRNVSGNVSCNVSDTLHETTNRTEPNHTEPNHTVKTKNPVLFSKEQEKLIKTKIAESKNHTVDSQANQIAFEKLVSDIAKDKSIKKPVAVALHRAAL